MNRPGKCGTVTTSVPLTDSWPHRPMEGMASVDSRVRWLLRQLPSVDELLQEPSIRELIQMVPRWAVVEAVREVLERWRRILGAERSESDQPDPPSRALLVSEVGEAAHRRDRPGLRRQIESTRLNSSHIQKSRMPSSA